jgi:hypothetical protein
MNSIQSNKTWELSVLPAGRKAIGLKCIFKVKKDPQGVIIKHKATLVAKGMLRKRGWVFRFFLAFYFSVVYRASLARSPHHDSCTLRRARHSQVETVRRGGGGLVPP